MRNYALTISQIRRDLEAVLAQPEWGLPPEIATTYFAISKRYDRRAYLAAWLIKRENYPQLAVLLSRVATPTFLRAIGDALAAINEMEGKKANFQLPTPTTDNIAASWCAAVEKLHNERFGEDNEGLLLPGEADPTIPTHAQVRDEFRRLFGQQLLPTDYTIRTRLQTLKLPYRTGKRGRPEIIRS